MSWWLVMCLVSLTLTQIEAETITMPPPDCECTCECEVPEVDCVNPPTPCTPKSRCENFIDETSEFSVKCAPKLSEMIVSAMYKDCLAAEEEGVDKLDDFCDNIILVCKVKDAEIKLDGQDCPSSTTEETVITTTCELFTKCDNLKPEVESDFNTLCRPLLAPEIAASMYKDCLEAEVAGQDEVDDLCENVIAICLAKGVEIECTETQCQTTTEALMTTTCVAVSKCENLVPEVESDFNTLCRPLLAPEIAASMYKDCLKAELVGQEEVDDLCENIIAVCSAKGVEIECPENPCPTTEILTTTVCEARSKCENLLPETESDFNELCRPLLAPEIAASMYKDCLKAELVGTDEVDDLCENIIAICSAKGVEIECPEVPCPTTTPEILTTTCFAPSRCENLSPGVDSDFNEKCRPLLAPEIAALMYNDCLKAELVGPDELDDLCENIITICLAKGVEIECHENPCPTTPESITTEPTYTEVYDNCTCTCVCKGYPSTPPVCTTTETVPMTTTVCDPCDGFEGGEFVEKCEDLLAVKIVKEIKRDCLKYTGDDDAINDLITNIEQVCATKGVEVHINPCDTSTTTETTIVTTTPCDPCFGLETGDFPEICEPLLQAEIVACMKMDCEALDGDLVAVRDLLDNIEAICEGKGVKIDIDDCGTSTTETPEITTTTACPCVDIVFMVDGSNSMGATDFQKEIDFLKMIMDKLPISDDCVNVGLLSFSEVVHVKVALGENNDKQDLIDNKADALIFESSITNTQKAIDELSNMLKGSSRGCNQFGVLITDGMSTDWRATLESMVNFYAENEGPRVVVVAIQDEDKNDWPRPDQVRAIASGSGNDNLFELDDFAELTDGLSQDVAALLLTPYTPVCCTQYAAIHTDLSQYGDMIFGVYEEDVAFGSCLGKPTYKNLNEHSMYLGRQTNSGDPPVDAWVVFVSDSPSCVDPMSLAYLSDFNADIPNVPGWTEVETQHTTMEIVCYN